MSASTDFVKNLANSVTYGRINNATPFEETGIQSQALSHAISTVKSKASLDIQRVDEDSVPESWVELGAPPSRGSVCSSVDALYITNDLVNVRSAVFNKSKSHNQSPNQEMESSDSVKAKSIVPPGKQTDWMWDWAVSRCEAVPPKEYQRMVSGSRHMSGSRQMVLQSALTTPPNSPIPSESGHSLSWRHSTVVKSQSYNTDVLFGLIVSNLITFILGSCIGYYLAKRVYENQKAA